MAETVHTEPPSASGSVTDEKYNGPGALVTGLGYVNSVHLATTGIAIGTGAILGALFHNNVNSTVKTLQATAMEWRTAGGFLKKRAGQALHWLFGYSEGVYATLAKDGTVMSQIPETIKGVGGQAVNVRKNVTELLKSKDAGFLRNFSQGLVDFFAGIGESLGLLKAREFTMTSELTRGDAAVVGGGILGITTWLGAWVWGLLYGGNKGSKGKEQFERAKHEVTELRSKYAEAQHELETLKSGKAAPAEPMEVKRDDQKSPEAPVVLAHDTPMPADGNQRRDDQKPGSVITAVSREAALAAQPTAAVTA